MNSAGLNQVVASILGSAHPRPRQVPLIGPAHLRPPGHLARTACRRVCWWCADYDRSLFDLMLIEHEGQGRAWCNALLRKGITHVDQLRDYPPYRRGGEMVDGLNAIHGLGEHGVAFIRRRLQERG